MSDDEDDEIALLRQAVTMPMRGNGLPKPHELPSKGLPPVAKPISLAYLQDDPEDQPHPDDVGSPVEDAPVVSDTKVVDIPSPIGEDAAEPKKKRKRG